MQGEDIGTTVLFLLPSMDSLKKLSGRVRSSAELASSSLKGPKLGPSLALQLEQACAKNRDLCLDFFRRCVQYAEIMTCPPHIAGPVSSHAEALDNLRGFVISSPSETTGISVESVVHARGLYLNQLSPFNSSH